ncbi:unnamed protein product [Caenorhabditis angaria]|uniref:HOOK N-terminal domain-containing protein n=1 Tax=Caenorhabditis angaria TaxID=860376 RepID=A0A9P1IRM8_9PELO|nr:unnamed protein product [Caenorhabditis angaria]
MLDRNEEENLKMAENPEFHEEDEIWWRHPLAHWLRDCACGDPPLIHESEWRQISRQKSDLPVQFREIFDGFLMMSVLRYIDPTTPRAPNSIANSNSDPDFLQCHQNYSVLKQKQLRTLFDSMARFYKQRLQQLIVGISTPNLAILARNQDFVSDESIEEINKLILLLLGCAIQSDKKREFIDRIQKFDPSIQIGLANYIQQLTQTSQIVVSALESDRHEVFRHLERVMKERDMLAEISAISEHDSDEASSTTTSSSLNGETHKESFYENRSTSPNSQMRQLVLELAHAKQEMRKWMNDAQKHEEESNQFASQLEECKDRLHQLENERPKLKAESKKCKLLEDYLQAANQRIEKLQNLENVEKRLRETQEEKESIESKYKSLSEHYRIQEETIENMELNLKTLKNQTKDRSDMEKEFNRSKSTVRDLEEEISKKNWQIENHLVEQVRLEHELKEREERIAMLESSSPNFTPRFSGSLAEQLEDVEKEEIANLRAENRKLRAQTEGATRNPEILAEKSENLNQELQNELKQALEQAKLENSRLKFEHEKIDGTLDRVSIELEQATCQIQEMRDERDEAVRDLQSARRKFAQFQMDFGEEKEARIRSLNFEIQENLRNIEELQYAVKIAQENSRKIRFELDEVQEEKSGLQIQMDSLERAKKAQENHLEALKSKNSELEDLAEDLRLKILNSENFSKRLEDREALISQIQEKLGIQENQRKTVEQQLDLELKKSQKLREDLVAEKSRAAEIVGKLRSVCKAVLVNGGKIEEREMGDDELISCIDNIMMNVLTNAKRESDALRIQQNKQIAELSDLKKDIEKLRRSENVSLSESDDRVKELSQENINQKEQIFLLQEKVRELGVEIAAKCNEISLAKNCIEELNRNSTSASANNTELARLQVSLRNAELQEELRKQENSELRKQLEAAEKAGNKIRHELDELESMHKTLLGDHSRLQHLHNSLTKDYEQTRNESVEMRNKLRTHTPMVHANLRDLEELRFQLAHEKSAKEKQLRAYADLQNEHGQTRRQLDNLRAENEHLIRNREALTSELRRSRAQDNALEWSNLADDLNKQIQSKDLEIAKLHHKIEALQQLNATYNEENKNLSRQLEILLTQNKELLNRALYDKDQYHLEMKDFQEQLSSLRRHKEKLEDKIMDQYRSMESKKSSTDRKQPLVKRAAKALIRRRASSNTGSTTEDSSAYSADESTQHQNQNDDLVPTCSSSDDHDRGHSPAKNWAEGPGNWAGAGPEEPRFLRQRGDLMGGSVRLSNGIGGTARRPVLHASQTYEQILMRDSPATISPLTNLPPRAPIRNASATSSLRARPPPYTKPKGVSAPLPPPESPPLFQPRSASTPKKSEMESGEIVGEGERRRVVREKEERFDKALSYYENVANPDLAPAQKNCEVLQEDEELSQNDTKNESTVWYEYGCV